MIYFFKRSNFPFIENIQVRIDDALFTYDLNNQVQSRLLNILNLEESSIILTDEMLFHDFIGQMS